MQLEDTRQESEKYKKIWDRIKQSIKRGGGDFQRYNNRQLLGVGGGGPGSTNYLVGGGSHQIMMASVGGGSRRNKRNQINDSSVENSL